MEENNIKMKVGIYIEHMDPCIGGGSALASSICDELKKNPFRNIEYCFIYRGVNNKEVTTLEGIEYININKYDTFYNKVNHAIKKLTHNNNLYKTYFYDHIANRFGIDIFWVVTPTYIETTWPFIYTVWDLGFRSKPYFPELLRDMQWEKREKQYAAMITKAAYVITGNKEGKKEILENYTIPANKIHISPFPVSAFCRGEEKKPGILSSKEYFFYPAQFWAHKNHICIIDAVDIIRQKYHMDVTVYFTGSDHGNLEYIKNEVKNRHLENGIIFTGFLQEKELKYLYTHATAMIFASLLGPNNLPPIEATYLNCPVIITDLPGHKEQLVDTAAYFDGYNPSQLAEIMVKMIQHKEYCNALKEKQKELRDKLDKIRYCDEINKILDEFSIICHRWQ